MVRAATATAVVLACCISGSQGFVPVAAPAATALRSPALAPVALSSRSSTALSAASIAIGGARGLAMSSLADRNTKTVDLNLAPVLKVSTSEEYHNLLAANPTKLVVFKWYAPWCRSCKAMDLRYRRMALERTDVVFAEIDVAESKELKKLHGVNVVPAIHMHAGHLGQVENFTCGPSKAPLLQRRVDMYADVAAYIVKAKGGLMEKVAAFSAGVASRVAIPAAAAATRAASAAGYALPARPSVSAVSVGDAAMVVKPTKGLMEKFEEANGAAMAATAVAAAAAVQPTLENLSAMLQ